MMTINSPFEKLQTHTHLVVTISEEKQLYEANLKFVMLRVNAATSLLKWAREEGNASIRSMVEQLYNITLMWATVQKQYAEQCLGFSKSLESILKVEQGLDAIRKQRKASQEKITNLQKLAEAVKKKSDNWKLKQLQEDIIKYSADEEELSAELQVKFIKGEIFKTKVLKAALQELSDTYSENAAKIKAISSASTSIIKEFPDVPTFFNSDEDEVGAESTESEDTISKLAIELGLSENIASLQNFTPVQKANKTSPTASPARPRGNSKLSQDETANQESKAKKRISKLPAALGVNFHIPKLKRNKLKGKLSLSEDYETDNSGLIGSSNDDVPRSQPPPLPYGNRRRSKSSLEIDALRQMHERQQLTKSASADISGSNAGINDHDDDLYEEPDYILPNSYGEERSNLVKWSSEDSISKNASLPEYRDPADAYEFPWFETSDDPIYDVPYDSPKLPKMSQAPQKPLPDIPLDKAPPKPKRSAVKEAYYINSNDVEKLLNEFYDDSKLNEGVKPEVKKRVFKKIRQERMKSVLRNQDSIIVLDVTEGQDNTNKPDDEPGYTNLPSPSLQGADEGDEKSGFIQAKRPPNKQPRKIPVRPCGFHELPEALSSDIATQPLSPASDTAPVAMAQANNHAERQNRPKVPPRPVNLASDR